MSVANTTVGGKREPAQDVTVVIESCAGPRLCFRPGPDRLFSGGIRMNRYRFLSQRIQESDLEDDEKQKALRNLLQAGWDESTIV